MTSASSSRQQFSRETSRSAARIWTGTEPGVGDDQFDRAPAANIELLRGGDRDVRLTRVAVDQAFAHSWRTEEELLARLGNAIGRQRVSAP
jgi:hypothetical protein